LEIEGFAFRFLRIFLLIQSRRQTNDRSRFLRFAEIHVPERRNNERSAVRKYLTKYLHEEKKSLRETVFHREAINKSRISFHPFVYRTRWKKEKKKRNRKKTVQVADTSVAFAIRYTHYLSVLVYTHHLLRTPAVNRHVDCPSKPGNFIAS